MNLKDLKTSRILMVVVIIVVSLMQGVLGLRGLYKEIQNEFYNGKKDSVAIYSDMEDLVEYGLLIKKVLVTNGYLSTDAAVIKNIDLAISQFESASVTKSDSMNVSIKSFISVKNAVDDLIYEADKMDMDEDTLKSYKQYVSEYDESLVFIKRSEFMESALNYNEVIRQFPASIFKIISRIEALDEKLLILE